MSAALVGMVVYDSVLFEQGHMIMRWANGIERAFTAAAIAEAPLNKRMNKGPKAPPVGTLKAGIHGSVYKVGPKHIQTDISSDAPYSMFVIGGTTGPITPHGKFLKLPRNAAFGGGRKTRFYSVSGQSANNFLGRAAAITARTHPTLRGFESQVFEQA